VSGRVSEKAGRRGWVGEGGFGVSHTSALSCGAKGEGGEGR
jgi:hypothetical protein